LRQPAGLKLAAPTANSLIYAALAFESPLPYQGQEDTYPADQCVPRRRTKKLAPASNLLRRKTHIKVVE
jgi:hypothetical protein